MNAISVLEKSLKVHLRWSKHRTECFVKMLLGLYTVGTISLRKIALGMDSTAQLDSRYKRLKKFFSKFEIDFTCIALWIFKLFFPDERKVYVIIDRTNWYWGKAKINIFMFSIAYEGIAIPLFWSLLPKAGSTNVEEQKELLNRFIESFGISRIAGVLGDREFGSGELFAWFNEHDIPFYIRIKEGSHVNIRGKNILQLGQSLKIFA